jgi:hypothetical protein
MKERCKNVLRSVKLTTTVILFLDQKISNKWAFVKLAGVGACAASSCIN